MSIFYENRSVVPALVPALKLRWVRIVSGATALLMAGLSMSPLALKGQANGGNKNPNNNARQSNHTEIGRFIYMDGWSFTGSLQSSKVDATSNGGYIESKDPKSPRQIKIFADHLVASIRPEGKRTATLNGHLRYTVIETVKVKDDKGERAYERVLKGTAGEAHYSEADYSLRLTNGVDATLNDPEQFTQDAVIHTGTLTLETGTEKEKQKEKQSVTSYRLEGAPGTNRLQYTPRPTKAAKTTRTASKTGTTSPRRSGDLGSIHIHHFDTGTILVGGKADFQGAEVVLDTSNTEKKTQNSLRAPHIVADTTPDAQSLDASGGIRFESRSNFEYAEQNKKRSVTQILKGTATRAIWQQDGPLDVTGRIDATLTNPATLLEPATLTASRLVADLGDKPRYQLTGTPDITRLSFTPRPALRKPLPVPQNETVRPARTTKPVAAGGTTTTELPPPASTPFVVGKMIATHFETATYEPNKKLVATGPLVSFTSDDPKTKNYGQILTPHFEADLDPKYNTLMAARANQGVSYLLRQPLAPEKSEDKEPKKEGTPQPPAIDKPGEPKDVIQTIQGRGKSMIFQNGVPTDGPNKTQQDKSQPDKGENNKNRQKQTLRVDGLTSTEVAAPERYDMHVELKEPNKEAESEAFLIYDLNTTEFRMEDPLKQTSTRFTETVYPKPTQSGDNQKDNKNNKSNQGKGKGKK